MLKERRQRIDAEIVDGLQRVSTVLEFMGFEIH